MWTIFDIEGEFVGVVTDEATENTNILRILEDADYIVRRVCNLSQIHIFS